MAKNGKNIKKMRREEGGEMGEISIPTKMYYEK